MLQCRTRCENSSRAEKMKCIQPLVMSHLSRSMFSTCLSSISLSPAYVCHRQMPHLVSLYQHQAVHIRHPATSNVTVCAQFGDVPQVPKLCI